MHLRNHQAMAIVGRVDIHEGERIRILAELDARYRAGGNLAENAVGIRGHGALPLAVRGEPSGSGAGAPERRYSAAIACGGGAERNAASSFSCSARAVARLASLM